MKSDSTVKPPLVFSGSAASLGFARFGIFAVWAVIVATTDVRGLAMLPDFLYSPTGILRIFGKGFAEHCTPGVMGAFQWLLCGWLVVLALGIRPYRWVAWGGVIGLLLFESWVKSYSSFINHGQLGILYAAIGLALFPAGDAWVLFRFREVIPKKPSRYASGMAFTAFVCALAYAFVGIRRLALGPEVMWDDSLPRWVVSRTLEPMGYGFVWGLDVVRTSVLLWMLKVGFVVTTVFEVISPWVLFHDRLRRCWLAVMVPFHLLTLLTMNIFFWENLVLVMIYFTGISYVWVPRVHRALTGGQDLASAGP
ncbi:MAG: hypothetical protein QM627_02720 [Luteolibacter sp.]